MTAPFETKPKSDNTTLSRIERENEASRYL